MNADKIKSIVSKKANGDSTISAQLYQMFFFERILDRISKSEYKHNIILKGGLLLSSIIGEDMRTTKDMDVTLKSIPLDKENIMSIMTEILNVDVNDDVSFEIIDIKDIREEDEYGGCNANAILNDINKNNVSCYIQKGILEGIKKFIIELNNQKEYDKLNYSLSKILIRRDSKI